MLILFFKGLAVGVIIAMPLGPVGFYCFHRSLSGGSALGLSCGLGAATADAFYATLAALGLTYLSSQLTDHHVWLQLGGGLFLLAVGLRTFLDKSLPQSREVRAHHMAGAFASTLALAAANPMTILAFAVLFAGLGLGQKGQHLGHALALVLGVFSGSSSWWVAIAFSGDALKNRLQHRVALLKRIAGMVIAGFGAAALASAAL